MQALKLDALSGWRWVRGGWSLFRKQPFGFVALLFFYWLLLLSASAVIGWLAEGIGVVLPFVSVEIVAALGGLLVAMITPALTVGFLQACRSGDGGQTVQPTLLFAPFRAGRTTLLRLLALGSIQVVALVVIVLITNGPGALRGDAPTAATTAAPQATAPASGSGSTPKDATQPTAEQQEAMRREAIARFKQGIAYVPVALVMWYAPMLVAWHGLPAGKAIFFSLVAVWRNRAAFVVYGAAWLAIWMALSIVVAVIVGLLGVANLAAIVAVPLVMLLLTCMYCSVYPTYATVFVDPVSPVVPTA